MDPNAALDTLRSIAEDAASWRALVPEMWGDTDPRFATQRDLEAAVACLVAYVGPEPVPTETEAHEASPSS